MMLSSILRQRILTTIHHTPQHTPTSIQSTTNVVCWFSSEPRVKVNNTGNGITHVILNSPNKLNALDMEMFESIANVAWKLRKEKDIRVIILSGEGRAFCSGLDVKSMVKGGNPKSKFDQLLNRPSGYERNGSEQPNHFASSSAKALGNLAQDVSYLWRDIPVPVIAVLQGLCFGGGMQIALGADFRYATPDCKLSLMEAKWGLVPDMSATITLRELIRMDVAKELIMTGRVILGKEASRIGLVTRCVVDPMKEALTLADEIIARSPDSVAATKMLLQETWGAEETKCLDLETETQKKLLVSWNQIAASVRNFGVKLPYLNRKD